MKPVDFAYAQPVSIAAAVDALSASNGNAKIMAGGQTLGPMLNLRFVQPDLVLDISRIPELRHVEERAGTMIIGACTTHAAIEDGRVPDVARGMLPHIASRIAYRAIRTRGTIGGSLAHADPAADWVSCLTALRAVVCVVGARGRRDVPIEQFIRGPLETALDEAEIIERVVVHGLSPNARWGYHKICRKTGEFAEAIGAVVIDRDVCRLVAGATSGKPVVVELPAADVASRTRSTSEIKAMLAAAGLHGDSYDMSIHTAAVRRALQEATAA